MKPQHLVLSTKAIRDLLSKPIIFQYPSIFIKSADSQMNETKLRMLPSKWEMRPLLSIYINVIFKILHTRIKHIFYS